MTFNKTTFNILYLYSTGSLPIPTMLIGHTAVLTVYLACNEERCVCEGPVDGIVNQFVNMFVWVVLELDIYSLEHHLCTM